jgi:hypothetical protein
MHNENGNIKCTTTFVCGGGAGVADQVAGVGSTHLSGAVDQEVGEATTLSWEKASVSKRRCRSRGIGEAVLCW